MLTIEALTAALRRLDAAMAEEEGVALSRLTEEDLVLLELLEELGRRN